MSCILLYCPGGSQNGVGAPSPASVPRRGWRQRRRWLGRRACRSQGRVAHRQQHPLQPGRVAPGSCPSGGSHRFRTCPIKASGSSSHGRPRANGGSPALRSGGVTVTGARVSVHPPCCPPTGRDSALPSLHRVPASRVPLLQRYYEVLRRPAADPTALRCSFAWPYLPVRLCSLPTDPTPARGLELWNWQPHARNCGKATTGPLRFLGNPLVPMPCSSTPAGPTSPGPKAKSTRPPC